MSTKFRVAFKSIKDQYVPDATKMGIIQKALGHFQTNFDWPQPPEKFLFVNIPSTAPISPTKKPVFDVVALYRVFRGVRRDLEDPEIVLCGVIQEMVNVSVDGDEFKKLIGTAFEVYIFSTKRQVHGASTFFNANLEVLGKAIDYNGYRTVDIGIDRLDDQNYFEMCECCLSVFGFKRKDTQIGFYSEGFKEVRNQVGGTTKLRLEMIVATQRGLAWPDLIIPYLPNLKASKVEVRAVTHWSPESVFL